MSSNNRAAVLNKIFKTLKKHYKPVVPPVDRTVLEHLLYACCLENARFEVADEAYARLKELYFDWNEVRVTTVLELAEVLVSLPDAPAAALRIKKSLQSIFEGAYTFDLEHLKKQNLGKSEKDLEKVAGLSPFGRAYIAQHALSGHAIPVSIGAIDALYAVAALNEGEADKMLVPGLERAIPKNKGAEFGSLLQQFGADLYASPGSNKLRAILAEIEPNFKDRLELRLARKEVLAAEDAARERERIRAARKEELGQLTTPKGASPKPDAKGKGDAKPAAKEEAPKAAKPEAKPAGKSGKPAQEALKPKKAEPAKKPAAKEKEKAKEPPPKAPANRPKPPQDKGKSISSKKPK